ncbi:MAG: adenylosuccinate lyase [Thermoplasmata archaeon]|nr:adenylosuccinate lyase [Thermoplasmata archaeon]
MAENPGELFCPLEFRYGRPKMRALFSREVRLRRALRIEAALAESEAELGIIPADAAREVTAAAQGPAVTLAEVDRFEVELKHDVMSIVRALAAQSGSGGRWVHYGATSGDITDTALALELKDSVGVLRGDLTELAAILTDLADKHRATPEVGRTHGQHAVPLTFGYKMAVSAAEVLRHRRRLDELSVRLCVGKMSGAVGTGAGFGEKSAEIEAAVMRRLGIQADEAPTQIVGRDRIAEFTNFLALIAGTAERLATEVRNLQRSEIGEVHEPFDEKRQVGSSTMAQKRNPMLSENVTSLARLVRAFALPPLENMAQWHERDLSNSANERVVLPHAIVLTDDILRKLIDIHGGLKVDAERMASNLSLTGGGVMVENLMLALTVRGVPRSDAHELLRNLSRDDPVGATLAARAKSDGVLRRHFSEVEIDQLLDPVAYVRTATMKTERAVKSLRRELAS